MLLEGLFLPLTTPFLPDGGLNPQKLRENVLRYSKTPAAGLVALSSIGQPSLLSDAETCDVLTCVAETAAAEKVLIAGIRRDSVLQTLDLITFAAHSGYDAALLSLPATLRGHATESEAQIYFETVADSAALPLILESGSGVGAIPIDLVIRASRHPNIIGLIDTMAEPGRQASLQSSVSGIRHNVTVTAVFTAVTRRMQAEHAQENKTLLSPKSLLSGSGIAVSQSPTKMLKTRTKVVGFQILSSRAASILDIVVAGGVGAMPPLAASAPQACYEVLAAWKDGDLALAAEKQHRLLSPAAIVEDGLGVAGIKYGCDLNGYFGGRPRLPWLPLLKSEREEVEALMAGIRN
jgi:4-hydroxy-2-oxoglutarate aldolase